MTITLNIDNLENVGHIDEQTKEKFEVIFTELIKVGALTGVRGGKTVIHFDADGVFQAIQLDYMPYSRRRSQHLTKP